MLPEPRLIAFDTSAAHCAVALLCGDEIVETRVEEMKKGQAEALIPICEDILSKHNLAWANISGIGVGVGPGNFTGLRVAVAAARGLAMALEKPAIGVTSFDALAFETHKPTTIKLPARRGHAYQQAFENGQSVSEPSIIADENGPDYHINDTSKLVENIAKIAKTRSGDTTSPPAPLYIQAADAAPSKPTGVKFLE